MPKFKQFLEGKGLSGAFWRKMLWVTQWVPPWGRGEDARKKGEDSLAKLHPDVEGLRAEAGEL